MYKLRMAIALAAMAAAGSAAAQPYPTRPITLIAPFPAGGPSDALARILSEPIRSSLGSAGMAALSTTRVTGVRSTSGMPSRIRPRIRPASVSKTRSRDAVLPSALASRVQHNAALPHMDALEPSAL